MLDSKICFLGTYTYALFNKEKNLNSKISGVDVQIYNWSRAFSLSGYEVSCMVGNFSQNKKETHEGVDLWRGSTPGSSGPLRGVSNMVELFFLLRKIDSSFYIGRGASGSYSFVASLFCRIYRKKYIHMIASDGDIDGAYYQSNKFFGILNRIGLNFSHAIIVQNKSQKKILERYSPKVHKVNNSFFMPDTEYLEKEKKIILWAGSTQSVKLPEVFIELAKNCQNYKFVMLIQRRDEGVYKKLLSTTKEIKNIDLIPDVPFSETDKYFKKAKIFINTSAYEGFPNTFIQSMMNKVPIISLNVDPDNLIEDQHLGRYCKGDTSELKKSLDYLFTNQEYYLECARNSYAVGRKIFSVESNIKSFINILNNLNNA